MFYHVFLDILNLVKDRKDKKNDYTTEYQLKTEMKLWFYLKLNKKDETWILNFQIIYLKDFKKIVLLILFLIFNTNLFKK